MHACMEKKHVTQVPTFLLAYLLTAYLLAYFQRIYLCGEATKRKRSLKSSHATLRKRIKKIVLKLPTPVKIHPPEAKIRTI